MAKGRVEHTIILLSGHRIDQECPGEVDNMLHLRFLPNFVDELGTLRSYGYDYRLLRRQDQIGAASALKLGTLLRFSMVMSPVPGASKVLLDFCPADFNLDASA